MSPEKIIGEFYLINTFFINVIIRVFTSVLSGSFCWRSNDSVLYIFHFYFFQYFCKTLRVYSKPASNYGRNYQYHVPQFFYSLLKCKKNLASGYLGKFWVLSFIQFFLVISITKIAAFYTSLVYIPCFVYLFHCFFFYR